MMKPQLILPALVLATALLAPAQQGQTGRKGTLGGKRDYPPHFTDAIVETYKTVGDTKLNVYIFNPPDLKPGEKRPAIVFFFSGGWTFGSPSDFEHQCRYLASRGMVAMTADYRVYSRQHTDVIECVKDAKSAVRWARANAERLGIDPERIAASGGSAGAHLAACTGVVDGLEPEGEDISISSYPAAMVLFNPPACLVPLDVPPDDPHMTVFKERMGDNPIAISPLHHVKAGNPPTVMFYGTADSLLPGAQTMQEKMKAVGVRCEIVTYEGQRHGFYGFGRSRNKYFLETLKETDKFLGSLGWLNGPDTVEHFEFKESK